MLRAACVVCVLGSPLVAFAQDIVLEEDVPADAAPYFEVPFAVPPGTVEIEVRHDDLSEANVLDWGLRDPERFRGWGGGNTEPAIVGVEAASRSYLAGPIPEGEWAVLIGQAKIAEPPGRYRVEIFFRTAPTLAPQPERTPYEPAAPLEVAPRWYAGDFHVHSRESGDARPTLDEVAGYAEMRGLDFVELSEHNTTSATDFIVDAQSRHPNLLFLPGIEVTTYWGHANAIGATEPVAFDAMGGTATSITTILEAIEVQGAAFSINHPVLDLGPLCIGCAWDLEAPLDRIHAIEVANGAYSVTGLIFYDLAVAHWDEQLATGARIAAIGGSDDHRAGVDLDGLQSPIGGPTTMVYADELSVAAIVRGVREGRTAIKLEGPDDPMVELFAGELMIGDTVTERAAELRAVVTGGAGAMLRFVRNGITEHTVMVDSDTFEATHAVTAPPGDVDDRWRAELVMGQPRVLTSHIWVQATGEPIPDAGPTAVDGGPGAGSGDGGGCGCAIAGARSESVWPLLVLTSALAVARRTRRRRAIDREQVLVRKP